MKMKSLIAAALVAAQLAAAAPAAAGEIDGRSPFMEDRRGAFAGLRLRAQLGGGGEQRMRAGLTLSPTTHSRTGAASRMDMGDGLELGISPGARPTVTLAGQQLDRMSLFGEEVREDPRNVSTVAKVAIVAGVVIVVGAVAFYHVASEASCLHDPGDC